MTILVGAGPEGGFPAEVAAAVAIVALAVMAPASSARGGAAPSPGSMALELGDLPKEVSGWSRAGAFVDDNKTYARIQGTALVHVVRTGRLTGYAAHFIQKLKRLGTGQAILGCCDDQVVSWVHVYDSTASAQKAVSGPHPDAGHELATGGRVAQQTRLFSTSMSAPYRGMASPETAYIIIWRDGSVVGEIEVGGVLPKSKDAFDLAHAQEARIAAALRPSGH
jgi:hypothetical protein